MKHKRKKHAKKKHAKKTHHRRARPKKRHKKHASHVVLPDTPANRALVKSLRRR